MYTYMYIYIYIYHITFKPRGTRPGVQQLQLLLPGVDLR